MPRKIDGIIPVMLTPFTEEGAIDYQGLEKLIEWYIDHGSDALFAVCQSSEMQFLSLEERTSLARFVSEKAAGRVPVIASGHISENRDDQLAELLSVAETGVDGVVLVTNRLDPRQAGDDSFMASLTWLLERLPADMPLGLYECPAPFRRLLTDDELKFCAHSGRFVILKDVSCDLATVKRRIALTKGSPLAILNANAAIAWDAMKAGSPGFNGVFTNFHPDLYKWLLTEGQAHPGPQLRAFGLPGAGRDGGTDGLSGPGEAASPAPRNLRLDPQPRHRLRHSRSLLGAGSPARQDRRGHGALPRAGQRGGAVDPRSMNSGTSGGTGDGVSPLSRARR